MKLVPFYIQFIINQLKQNKEKGEQYIKRLEDFDTVAKVLLVVVEGILIELIFIWHNCLDEIYAFLSNFHLE